MKSKLNFLLSLVILFSYVSCTEEISEEITNDNKTTENNTNTNPFVGKSLRLVNKMDPDLSFIMHKYGDMKAACEIPAPANGFDAEDYDRKDKNYAIDCMMDVQELDLNFHGLSFEIQADEGLCEYITYRPYHYVKYPFGRTDTSYYEVECDEICGAAYPSVCGKAYTDYTGNSTDFRGVATDFAGATSYENPQRICMFDWSAHNPTEAYPNCDLGKRTPIVITINSVDDDNDTDTPNICNTTGDSTVDIDTSYDAIDCEGSIAACLGGAGTESLSETVNNELVYEEAVTYFETDEGDVFGREISYDAPIYKNHLTHNLHLANFSRVCSETSTPVSTYETAKLVGHEVEMINKDFTYLAIDLDGNPATGGDIAAYQYAHHALHAASGVNPYYQILCLDKAQDVKAQIRLFVREWDKNFTKFNVHLGRLSDVNSSLAKFMDLADALQDGTSSWNDRDDHDDHFVDKGTFSGSSDLCQISDNADLNDDDALVSGDDAYDYDLTDGDFPAYRAD